MVSQRKGQLSIELKRSRDSSNRRTVPSIENVCKGLEGKEDTLKLYQFREIKYY